MNGLHTELDAAWEDVLRPFRRRAGPTGILFSGGVDSSLLAWELRQQPEVTLWTMGREGSADLRAGQVGARLLGLPWTPIAVGPEHVRAAQRRFASVLHGLPNVTRAVLLSLALAMDGAGPRFLVCGQGVDELFLGYAHYAGLSVTEAGQRSREDLDRLHEVDWPRTRAIAEMLGKEVAAPYLAPAFEHAARQVPMDLLLPRGAPKRFFREWARNRGLPEGLSVRPKKALQYGSGVAALVRKLRSDDGTGGS